MLPLFAPAALPVPLATYDPSVALPDFATRVEKLRRWQQSIASGYVTTQKEEALQAEFLHLVFGQALGYEFERPDYRQLLLEKKTNVDGTKPDGALGDFAADPKGALGGPVRAVVELKDARTNLDAKQKLGPKGRAETPVEQAFSYPSKMGSSCRWVVVSNFVELRLYAANDQTRAEVFDFRSLPDQPAALQRFFALLGAGQLLPTPGQADAQLDQALRQRQDQEARISKDFYRDYRAARRALLDHLIEQNPAVAPLELLQHTQKLLDRVIFVCFCEDKNIIPRLTFRRLLDNVRANVFDPADDKIYRNIRGLFQSIDLGNPAANINRFNGGLFAPDAALDALTIKDRTLEPVISLERYDFASELNVNILGHIFEQSLADLEAERARLQGQAPPDAKQGKRKQDGIFYTPDYITRYIVGQAVGGWLRERRRETGLDDLPELTNDDRATIRVRQVGGGLLTPSTRVQKHIAAWEAYGQRLRAIRVLDPACGSGAFLNEAFGYLLREGQAVNKELAELRAGQFEVFDLDRHILQHNLYGVDLNPESVQITRLSLWLQTANPGRPLTSLDHSIRCGNSLIADAAVAGDRAFDWQTSFPEVFADGGFDVVIGNPPYITFALGAGKVFEKDMVSFLKVKYPASSSYKVSSYLIFIEKSLAILNSSGNLSFIIPNTYHTNYHYKDFREYLLNNFQLSDLMNLRYKVFEDAEMGFTSIPTIWKKPVANAFTTLVEVENEGQVNHLSDSQVIIAQSEFKLIPDTKFLFSRAIPVWEKAQQNSILLGSSDFGFYNGIKTGDNEKFLSDVQIDERYKLAVSGKDFQRYHLKSRTKYVLFDPKQLWSNTNEKMFTVDEKLIIRRTSDHLLATYDNEQKFTLDTTHLLFSKNSEIKALYLLSLLNSRLFNFLYRIIVPEEGKAFAEVKIVNLKKLPVKVVSPADQQPFITLADRLLTGHRELHAADAQFATLLHAELDLTTPLTGKLALNQEWKAWSTALQKVLGRTLTLAEKGEWLPHHIQHQEQQAQRRQHLAQLDRQLDQLVYQLYQLTPAEIALIEG